MYISTKTTVCDCPFVQPSTLQLPAIYAGPTRCRLCVAHFAASGVRRIDVTIVDVDT